MKLIEERFHKNYKKVESGCWEWIGTLNQPQPGNYYSRFWDGKKQTGGHRYSYALFNNVILTKDNVICHSCDNTICVNPDHLFLGTHKDNADDRDSKGRQAFGEKNGASIITESVAKKIIKELNGKRTNYRIVAEKFETSVHIVARIARNQTWKHLPREVSK